MYRCVHKDSLQMQLGDGENPSVETSIAEFSSQMQEIKSNGESAMVFDMHESARKFMQVHGKYMHKLASPTGPSCNVPDGSCNNAAACPDKPPGDLPIV